MRPLSGVGKASKHGSKKLKAGGGTVDKAAVVGIRDRETGKVRTAVVSDTKTETLQGFVAGNAAPDAHVYHDDATAYRDLPFNHASVKTASASTFDGKVYANGT